MSLKGGVHFFNLPVVFLIRLPTIIIIIVVCLLPLYVITHFLYVFQTSLLQIPRFSPAPLLHT